MNKTGLLVITGFTLIPAYIAASKTTAYDSISLTVANMLAILVFAGATIFTWVLPTLILWKIYKIRGLKTDDIPNSYLYGCLLIGGIPALYLSQFFSGLYPIYQSFCAEFLV